MGLHFYFFYIFFVTNKGSLNSQKEIMISSTLWYIYSFVQMCILVGTRFAGERCGPWASCLYIPHLLASVWQWYSEYSARSLLRIIGRRPAAGSIFFKRTGKGGYSEVRCRKSVLILPLLGPWSFGWDPNHQESGGAWVTQVLVWALCAWIH